MMRATTDRRTFLTTSAAVAAASLLRATSATTHIDGSRPHADIGHRKLAAHSRSNESRRRHCAVSRQGRDHVEVRLEHRSAWTQQQAGANQVGRGGHAQTLAHRSHRTALPAPRRSAAAVQSEYSTLWRGPEKEVSSSPARSTRIRASWTATYARSSRDSRRRICLTTSHSSIS